MSNKIKSIADFMKGLPAVTESGECYSEVIVIDQLDMITGGETKNTGCNGSNCINELPGTCNTNMRNCKNYNGVCAKSDNGGNCYNTTLQRQNPNNGAICQP